MRDGPERDAWLGRAYDQHAAGLYRYALMLLADAGDAADVVQQVFLSLALSEAFGGDALALAQAEAAVRADEALAEEVTRE